MVLAEGDGVVTKVDATAVTVRYDSGETKEYKLIKFLRSNHTTCINQRPIVSVGERVHGLRQNEKGEWEDPTVLADGPATDQGEIALGRNILVGFMTWRATTTRTPSSSTSGWSGRTCTPPSTSRSMRSTPGTPKLGPEEITRDIPNVGEDALKDLDERGIIRIGAEVRSGDILVGKVTPKGETDLTAEERLLRAIFGEKAREVRDTSLKVPHGEERHRGGRQGVHPGGRRRAGARRQRGGPGLHRPEAEDLRGRQDGPAATATRASSPGSCPRRTCPSCPTAPPWTSC